jgi:RNA polymerase sigma-70 factor (ECF subfamily)
LFSIKSVSVTGRDIHINKDLLLRVAAGDESAFVILFDTFKHYIYAAAYKLSDSHLVAEEVVQEVFLKVWIRRISLEEVTHFKAWLFTIARNETFDMMKRMAKEELQKAGWKQSAPPALQYADELLLNKEYESIMLEAISMLPPQQYKVYELVKTKGLSREYAATILNLSPETVKAHLSQAMRKIRSYCLERISIWIVLLLTLFM